MVSFVNPIFQENQGSILVDEEKEDMAVFYNDNPFLSSVPFTRVSDHRILFSKANQFYLIDKGKFDELTSLKSGSQTSIPADGQAGQTMPLSTTNITATELIPFSELMQSHHLYVSESGTLEFFGDESIVMEGTLLSEGRILVHANVTWKGLVMPRYNTFAFDGSHILQIMGQSVAFQRIDSPYYLVTYDHLSTLKAGTALHGFYRFQLDRISING